MNPTPPAAPETATTSPCFSPTDCMVAQAVVPATYREPAASHGTFAGLGTTWSAGRPTASAWLDPFVTPTDHPIAGYNTFDALAHLAHHASEVAALPGGKGSRPALLEEALADRRLARVDCRGHDVHHEPSWSSPWTRDLYHLQHIDVPVLVEPNGSHRRTRHRRSNSGPYPDMPPDCPETPNRTRRVGHFARRERLAFDQVEGKQRRGGPPMMTLEDAATSGRVLAHTPPVGGAAFGFMYSLLSQADLDARLREIATLRVAHRSDAPYTFAQHSAIAASGGERCPNLVSRRWPRPQWCLRRARKHCGRCCR